LIITSVVAIPLTTHTAGALPGNAVDNPANVWAPYGPRVSRLVLNYYGDPSAELSDFVAGKLDLTDWTVPFGAYSSYDANPDITISPVQGEYSIFGIFFNGASSTWNAWGCNWSNSTGTTFDSQCGIEMRQAFAHLVNRGDFANSMAARPAVGIADPNPPTSVPAGSSLATQCSWDEGVMVKYATGCYNHWGGLQPGAYSITGSGSCNPTTPGSGPIQLYQNCNAGLGFPPPGSPDFCAAALHVITADIATGMTSNCILTGVNSGVFSQPLRLFIRRTNPRLTLGQQFVNQLNALFGGTAAVILPPRPCIGIGPCYNLFPEPGADWWDAYTYGYSLPGPFGGTSLFPLYDSQFSSSNGTPGTGTPCTGAIGGDTPENPSSACNPRLDALLAAQNSSPDVAAYSTNTLAAYDYFGRIVVDIPVYSPGMRIAALTCVGGLVNARGFGYNSYFDLLNAHQRTGCVASNPAYSFGGGDSTTLRYGQASDTTELNVFNAQTVWEYQTIGEIYDTLFQANPVSPNEIFCWMCNSYAVSVDSSGNTHFLVQLRQNLRWQDGVPVDARDVAFSLLSLRDLAPVAGGALQGLLLNVQVISNTTLDIVFQGRSILYPVDLETFIIPRHLWQCDLVSENDCAAGDALVNMMNPGAVVQYSNAGVNVPSGARVDPSFDPLANHALIGSGPFECKSLFPEDLGSIGTGCTKNADGTRGAQAIPIGGEAVLNVFDNTANSSDPFDQYMRSFNPSWGTGSGTAAESGQFQEFSYADQAKAGYVTLFDLASIAACFGASGPTTSCSASNYAYWQRTVFETTPGTISREAAIVASHYGDTYVSPYSWNSADLENIVSYP
jgi:ABC-type transport system substrate-binding protein